MRAPWTPFAALALALVAPTALPGGVATAQEDGGWHDDQTAKQDEFDTAWVGARFGAWYRPAFKFTAEVSGASGLTGLLGSSIDAEADLGLTENPKSGFLVDFDQSAVLEIGGHVETRFLSVFGWWVAPFEYEGDAVLARAIDFGGFAFTQNLVVESRFRQFFLGADIEINILNNRYVRVSPLAAGRMIGVDWEVKEVGTGVGGNTDDIDTPLSFRGFQMIPVGEVGIDVRLGYRDYIDFAIKAAGAVVQYAGVEGTTIRVEATATFYPVPYVGLELGARYLAWELTSTSDSPTDQFDLDLRYTGATLAVIFRLG